MSRIVGIRKITFGCDVCHSKVGYRNGTGISAISSVESLRGKHSSMPRLLLGHFLLDSLQQLHLSNQNPLSVYYSGCAELR